MLHSGSAQIKNERKASVRMFPLIYLYAQTRYINERVRFIRHCESCDKLSLYFSDLIWSRRASGERNVEKITADLSV